MEWQVSPEIEQKLLAHESGFYSKLHLFECYDGWADILIKLGDRIQQLRRSGRLLSNVRAAQVKEKFGRLVIYTSCGDEDPNGVELDLVEGLVKEAQEASWIVCEHCGQPGSIRRIRNHWLVTLCDLDYEKWMGKLS